MGFIGQLGDMLNGKSSSDSNPASLQGFYTLEMTGTCQFFEVITATDEAQLEAEVVVYGDDGLEFHGINRKQAMAYTRNYKASGSVGV
jgi:hypothetical protein